MGANGAGKTTTLRAISGLVKPLAGTIALEGRDLAGMSPTARVRAGIVHVPQDRGIFYGLTVDEHFRLDGHGDRDRPRRRSSTSRRCAISAAAARACCRAESSRCWPSRGR